MVCLSSGFSCKLTSGQNCVRSLTWPPLPAAGRHQGFSHSLSQFEIPGKFQILEIIVSIVSEPKGGAHNPLWIIILHICSLLWMRGGCLEHPKSRLHCSSLSPNFLLRCRPHLHSPASAWHHHPFFCSTKLSLGSQGGSLIATASNAVTASAFFSLSFSSSICKARSAATQSQ